MANFFERILGRTPKGTSNTAKERLQVVLSYDRFNLPPEKMREMKEEILAVISKYVQIDRESVDIALEQRDRNSSKIRAEIPFTPGRRINDLDEDVPDHVKTSSVVDIKDDKKDSTTAKDEESKEDPKKDTEDSSSTKTDEK
jgi:cell division topological specificity factor